MLDIGAVLEKPSAMSRAKTKELACSLCPWLVGRRSGGEVEMPC